jgi:hypothetical protein
MYVAELVKEIIDDPDSKGFGKVYSAERVEKAIKAKKELRDAVYKGHVAQEAYKEAQANMTELAETLEKKQSILEGKEEAINVLAPKARAYEELVKILPEVTAALNALPDPQGDVNIIKKEAAEEQKTDRNIDDMLEQLPFDETADCHETALELNGRWNYNKKGKMRKRYTAKNVPPPLPGMKKGKVMKRDYLPAKLMLEDDIVKYSEEAEERLKGWGAEEGKDYEIFMGWHHLFQPKKKTAIITMQTYPKAKRAGPDKWED